MGIRTARAIRPTLFAMILSLGLPLIGFAQFGTELEPATVSAFQTYQRTVESSLKWQPRYARLAAGEVKIDPAQGDGNTDVKSGIVHDWVAATMVPGATVEQVLDLLRDYDSYADVYQPEVMDAKVLRRSGDNWHVFLKMYKEKVLTAELNGEFDVEFRDRGRGRWTMVSRSTRIAEVEDGAELPVGQGKGFLWRLNAYWLIEPRPGGVYLEVRSLSLSRGIPFGLGFVIKPFITGVPRESLNDTMVHTVDALQLRVARAGAAKDPTVAE